MSETPPKEVKPWHRQKHSSGPAALLRSPNGFGQGNHTKERTFILTRLFMGFAVDIRLPCLLRSLSCMIVSRTFQRQLSCS